MARVKVGPAFFDSVSGVKSGRLQGSRKFASIESSYFAPVFFLLLLFAIIIARLFYIQIIRESYYKDLSDANRTRTEIVPAPRGIILDRLGRPLVSNSPAFKIVDSNNKVQFVSKDAGLALIAQGKHVENDVERDYLYKGAFAHVLGYVGQISQTEMMIAPYGEYSALDFIGKSGIESQYENILHGTNGRKLFEVDSQGNMTRELGTQAPINGENITTTLDKDVGLSVYNAMKNTGKGAVVVSDPRTGGILALFSSPTFDPNLMTRSRNDSSISKNSDNYKPEGNYKTVSSILLDSQNQPLLDRTISGVYPPGSTFKLVAASAALQKGSITENTEIEDTGVLKVGNFSFGNWYYLQNGKKEGMLDIIGAIKRSNDIFFYKTAEQTGVDYISNFAKTFGYGQKTNIDLPSEAKGTVPTVEWKEKIIGEQWYLGDTYNYGIGQGYLLATPLQVNMMTDVFANDGTLYQPHLIQNQPPKVVKQNFVSKKNMDLIREGMREACDTGGVAWPFFNFQVKNPKLKIDGQDYIKEASSSADMVHVNIGCKTGTAETGDKDTTSHAWITVFAPFYHPEIAVTVLVENGGEGSSIAGPIAKAILTDYFEKKNN